MTSRNSPWAKSQWFIRAAQALGILEMAGGLWLLSGKQDGAQGYALLAIGAATFGSMPWITRPRSRTS